MEWTTNRVDDSLLEEIVNKAVQLTRSGKACLLLYDSVRKHLDCRYGTNCKYFSSPNGSKCSLSLEQAPQNLQLMFANDNSSGFIFEEAAMLPAEEHNGSVSPSSQMLIPLRMPQTKPLGLLVFEAKQKTRYRNEDVGIAHSVAEFCLLALQKSQQLADSDRMVAKLRLLSDASNILLAEFENKSLSQKLDHVVEKTTEILDAELSSLWLVKDGMICLETSYSSEGKVSFRKGWSLPIQDTPKSGMTGFIASNKKVFNDFGESLFNHRAKNPDNPVDFLSTQRVHSELAYPILDDNGQLIGLLIAYNKKGINGKPLENGGFSIHFDEPLMKILTTKLLISINNTNLIQRERELLKKQRELLKTLRNYELIVESTPDPVVICTKAGVISYMNPGAKALLGDLSGSYIADYFPNDETSTGTEKAREIKKRMLRDRDKRLRNYETQFMNKSGEAIPLSLSASLLYDEHGKESGTIGIAKDLREIKALLATGQSLIETQEVDAILNQITQLSLRLSNSKRAYIKLYDPTSDRLVFRAWNPKNPDEEFLFQSTPKYQGMTGHVFRTQKPYRSHDVSTEPPGRYVGMLPGVKSKIAVPITYTDKETGTKRQLGIISVDSEELNAFSSNDTYFLATLANQAAAALETATLITSKNKIITNLRAFDRIQQATSGKEPDVDQILDGILDAVVNILGFKYATISKVDRTTHMIGTVKGRNVPDEFLRSAWHSLDSQDIQAWVVRHKDTVYLTGWDDRLDNEIFEKYNHDSLVRTFIPIIARDEVLGTLETGCDKAEKHEIGKDEIETLQRIVNLAGIGIEQANLLKRLKDDIALTSDLERQLDALNHASIQILNSTTEHEVIDHIFKSLESIGYAKGMLSLVNEDLKTIEAKYAQGDNWNGIVTDTNCALGSDDLLAQVIRIRNPILSKNCAKDPRCHPALVRKAKVRSQYVIPLIVKDKPIGTLQIDLSDHQKLVQGDEALFQRRMKVLETFARQSAIAIHNIRNVITIDRLEANIAETAHEFRSPLHNIMTQVGGLKDYLEHSRNEKEIDQFVDIIEEEIYRAKRQVDNSLLLSERTQEAMEFDFKEGYIQDVIKGCVDAYRLRALERGLRFIIRDSVKHLPKFPFDRDKIAQAITNLVDNAVKYSLFNQHIDISGFDDGTRINFEITDRGLGIPANEFDALFRGFTRGGAKDAIRYIPGTGLGLKICKEIIEKHGGEIKVIKSEPVTRNPEKIQLYQDYETTFRFSLPKSRKER